MYCLRIQRRGVSAVAGTYGHTSGHTSEREKVVLRRCPTISPVPTDLLSCCIEANVNTAIFDDAKMILVELFRHQNLKLVIILFLSSRYFCRCIDLLFYYPKQPVAFPGSCGYEYCIGNITGYSPLDSDSDFNRTFGTSTSCNDTSEEEVDDGSGDYSTLVMDSDSNSTFGISASDEEVSEEARGDGRGEYVIICRVSIGIEKATF